MKRAAIAAAALVVLGLGGCASEGDPPVVQDPGADVLLEDPCTLFTESDLEAIFDEDLGEGSGTAVEVTEAGTVYTANECRWTNPGVDVVLQVAQADDFAEGQFECLEPVGGEVTEIDGLGDEAWWLTQEQGELTAGLLRACTENLLVTVLIAGATDDTQMFQDQAQAVAEVVLTVGRREEG